MLPNISTATGYITPAFSGFPDAFSGSPTEGDKIRNGYIVPAFLGADCLAKGGGGNKHRWVMVKNKALLANTPPLSSKLPSGSPAPTKVFLAQTTEG